MPPIRSLASECYIYTVTLILLLGVIMPIYSYYTEKKLVYVIIITLFSCQPFSCFKYIKLNIRSSYNIKSVSNIEYIFLISLYSL